MADESRNQKLAAVASWGPQPPSVRLEKTLRSRPNCEFWSAVQKPSLVFQLLSSPGTLGSRMASGWGIAPGTVSLKGAKPQQLTKSRDFALRTKCSCTLRIPYTA